MAAYSSGNVPMGAGVAALTATMGDADFLPIPLSALLGNAISNDGDALFPAIALSPQVAFLTTTYSTIPALMIAYGFYFFAPGFL